MLSEEKEIQEREDEKIDLLTNKLKEIKKMIPKLSQTSSYFNQSRTSKSRECSPNKSMWTDTATGWTRDIQPVYTIPKSQRLLEATRSNKSGDKFYLKSDLHLRSKINERGIKFSQDKRHELFTIEVTPSPNQYNCKRYLECFDRRFKAKNSKIQAMNPQIYPSERIRGGTIGNFRNHPSLYDPQISKVGYNEKMINEASVEKQKSKSFKIRINEKRTRSII